jgi:hypothetical protein
MGVYEESPVGLSDTLAPSESTIILLTGLARCKEGEPLSNRMVSFVQLLSDALLLDCIWSSHQ